MSKGAVKAVDNIIKQVETKFGRGSIMRLGDRDLSSTVEVVSSGSPLLDRILGVGGFPKGRVCEIFGPEASGKTTLALHVIAQVQASGGHAAFVDAEHALDPVYAGRIGVKTDELLLSQPSCGEEALEICEILIRSNAIDIVVVDSVAALVPRAEIEGAMGDIHVGLQARLMSQAMRKLTAVAAQSKTILLFINQVRDSIGSFTGPSMTTTGGRALKFYSSLRLDIRRTGQIKTGEDIIGSTVAVKVVKNKLAPPFKVANLDIYFSEGISLETALIDMGEEAGLLTKNGSTYYFGSEKLGTSREKARLFLKEHPEFRKELAGRLEEFNVIVKAA